MIDTDTSTAPDFRGEETSNLMPAEAALRTRAEEIVQGRSALPLDTITAMSPQEIQRTFHELEVHRIELAMQNEELSRAYLQLDAERTRYASLYDLAPAGYCTLDEQDLILKANFTLANLLGVSPGALRGQALTRFILGHDQDLYYLHRKQLTGSAEPQACELRMRHLDGTVFWAHLAATAMHGADGRFEYRLVISDITERKQSEESLRESEERFRILHEAASGGIVIHDQGIIVDCNQGLAGQTGYSMEELRGMDGLLLIAPGWRDLVRQNIQRGYEQIYEVEGLRKEGTTYPLSIQGRAIPYKGRVVRVTEFRDITERQQAEEERVRLQAQLMQAQKMESIGRLAGGVAHDFNNMLSVILGVAEMVEEKLEPASPLRKDLREIGKAALRSVELTRQLLAFARKQIVAPQVLDLNDAIEGLLKMLRRLVSEEIQLVWLPCSNLWPVKIDPTQVDQILANLCVNARDAIAGTGKITIETGNVTWDAACCPDQPDLLPGDYALLTVSDDGCGMDAATLALIFEPFFTTKEVGVGTGLGLSTVYGIVKQNKGVITVSSEPEQGATFRIYLPRHEGPVTANSRGNNSVTLLHGHKTVLLVEDERSLLHLNKRILESLGYTVIAAAAPGEALRLAREYPGAIDLLLTDIIMPDMNGRDLAVRLQQIYPGMKQLFMSGYTSDVIAHHGVLDEGVMFLQKPFSKRDLVAKINEIFS